MKTLLMLGDPTAEEWYASYCVHKAWVNEWQRMARERNDDVFVLEQQIVKLQILNKEMILRHRQSAESAGATISKYVRQIENENHRLRKALEQAEIADISLKQDLARLFTPEQRIVLGLHSTE